MGGVHEEGGVRHLGVAVVFGEDRGVVEHGGQHVDGGHGDQEQEGGLHQGALVHRLAVQDGHAEGHQERRSCAVHRPLVEQQPLRPPAERGE